MNLYRVYYEYLDNTCDNPNVTVEGETEVKAATHHEAKKSVRNNHALFFKRGFKVIKSKLLSKNVDRLKKVKIDDKNCLVGISASFLFLDEEIVITAKSLEHLQKVLNKLYTNPGKLKKSLCKETKISPM